MAIIILCIQTWPASKMASHRCTRPRPKLSLRVCLCGKSQLSRSLTTAERIKRRPRLNAWSVSLSMRQEKNCALCHACTSSIGSASINGCLSEAQLALFASLMWRKTTMWRARRSWVNIDPNRELRGRIVGLLLLNTLPDISEVGWETTMTMMTITIELRKV